MLAAKMSSSRVKNCNKCQAIVRLLALPAMLAFTAVLFSAVETLTPSQIECVEEGKFELVDGSCTKFYVCLYDGEKYSGYAMSCGTNLVFDPTRSICVPSSEYACTQTTTTTVPCATSTSTAPPCYKFGRFPIADPYCQKYYLCFWDGLTFTRINLQCPNTLCFNSTFQRCITQGSCQCSSD